MRLRAVGLGLLVLGAVLVVAVVALQGLDWAGDGAGDGASESTGKAPAVAPTVAEPDPEAPTAATPAPRADTPDADEGARAAPSRRRAHVGREAPCSEPHGPVHVLLEIEPPDDRSREWWAVELRTRISSIARKRLPAEARDHIHTRLEPDRAAVRLWIDRVPRVVAREAFQMLRVQIEASHPQAIERDRERQRLDEVLVRSGASRRMLALDLRHMAETAKVNPETIDVDVRTAEAEIEAWTTERATARARRDWPELTDAQRADFDRYLAEADAAMERLTDRLAVLRRAARRIEQNNAEMRREEELRVTAQEERTELMARGGPAQPFLHVTEDFNTR